MTRTELERLERRAAAGDAAAQYEAGCARHDGDDESLRSIDRAVRWLRLAADQGHAPAARRLGYVYVVDEKDVPEGIRWYSRAAEQGDGAAAFSLGHLVGDRDRRAAYFDPTRAIGAFEQALSSGQPRAGLGLGLLLLAKDLPMRDPHRGARLVSEASTHGFIEAFRTFAHAQGRGRLVPTFASDHPDSEADPFPFRPSTERLVPDADVDTLHRRARDGDAAAIHDLGVLCWCDLEPRFARPPIGDGRAVASACLHFSSAAEGGVASAQFAVGCLSLIEPGFRSTRRAIDAFEAAADQGHVTAHRALAWIDRHHRLRVTVASV